MMTSWCCFFLDFVTGSHVSDVTPMLWLSSGAFPYPSLFEHSAHALIYKHWLGEEQTVHYAPSFSAQHGCAKGASGAPVFVGQRRDRFVSAL